MYAIVHKKVDLYNFEFEIIMSDISELNSSALNHKYDITKASSAILPFVADNYVVLNSGSAFGLQDGPLLVAKKKELILKNPTIAIPGEYTSANLLLNTFFKNPFVKKQMIFYEIMDSILSNKVDAGVIIHEDRFVYKEKGLIEIIDLGKIWYNTYRLPVPLGIFLAKKSFSKEQIQIISEIIRQSIVYAKENSEEVLEWVKYHAQTLDEEVINKHINHYVNELSNDMGEIGKKSIEYLHNSKVKTLNLQTINNYYNIELI